MYKLVAIDIDGTLLNSKHLLDETTIKRVKEVQKSGIKVILVSGRDFIAAKPYMDVLNTKDLLVGLNGCRVYDSGGEIIFSEDLSYNISKEILSICEEEKLYTVLFIDKNTYVEKKYDFMDVLNYVKGSLEVGKLSLFYKNQIITKFLLVDNNEKLNKIKKRLDNHFGEKINSQFSLPHFLEIFNGKVNKGVMLKKICNLYNINTDEVIAIGDWDNDLSMIEYAGLGIAMENGSENLKIKADYITKSNDNLGVAFALEKFILNK
ncbi:Cof-type HAD-IIB family hydrolase [Clostridium rectalis]|uniref:Cof-type HAD-IIB family hydrolase n=1 Tax=Clostridium rectalis TaxID=2040295 RepID=UPI000F63A9A9|nr:Cof-type HAD-IIB family hydrolase [Clostridium rectalis]